MEADGVGGLNFGLDWELKNLQLSSRHPPPVLNARAKDTGPHKVRLLLPPEPQHGARLDHQGAEAVGGAVHDAQVEPRRGAVAHAEGEGTEDAAVLFVVCGHCVYCDGALLYATGVQAMDIFEVGQNLSKFLSLMINFYNLKSSD